MVTFEPIVEAPLAGPASLWPVADVPADGWLRLSADTSGHEIGLVVRQLVLYNQLGDGETAADLLARLARAELLIAPGGLRVRDSSSGVVVAPGCCAGLEQWREWERALEDGYSPWLGHDPDPWVEQRGAVIRVWSDGGLATPREASEAYVDVAASELPRALERARLDLLGFLEVLERWAAGQAPTDARLLAESFDRHFRVSAPLGTPAAS